MKSKMSKKIYIFVILLTYLIYNSEQFSRKVTSNQQNIKSANKNIRPFEKKKNWIHSNDFLLQSFHLAHIPMSNEKNNKINDQKDKRKKVPFKWG